MPRVGQRGTMPVTAEHVRYHRTTTLLITQFLQYHKLSSETVDDHSFKSLCRHLNPLVQIPSPELVDNMHIELGHDQLLYNRFPPCILCGIESTKHKTITLNDEVAAIFLTTAVISDKISIKQAKHAMLCSKLNLCEVHVSPLKTAMYECIGGDSCSDFDDIPDYAFLGGLAVFIKLMTIRQIFDEEPVKKISEVGYRDLLRCWMSQDLSKAPLQTDLMYNAHSTRPAPSKPSTSLKQSVAAFYESLRKTAPETVPGSLNVPDEEEGPGLKKVKLEEPDFNEDVSSSEPSSSVPTPSLIPLNVAVYTLKNGKKVVKAPAGLAPAAAMLTKNTGRLQPTTIELTTIILQFIYTVSSDLNYLFQV
ncbi:hypothetical protein CRE_02229 [Caenorhabditis remanei]|uniref:Lin-15A/B-like domain-containing protein n=1 Tax=Caenorhabditis remanei TaxID=31234 RepID=E3LFS9_CAERE|nr:hypothetical protein CRE_02229 [Caenorhabditis remanei]